MSAKKLLLLIEDDLYIRGGLQEFLESEGYRVRTAQNGKEGLDVLAALTESPGLILLDLMMPIMDGRAFLQVKAQQASIEDIPVVVITAAGDQVRVDNVKALLRKPIDLDLLLETIEKFAQ